MQSIQSKPWLPYLIIAFVLAFLAAIFLWPSPWEFPMDDTYIHFVYAQNLAHHGQLFFNEPGETGVGTTSLTWVMLLAGADWLGIPFNLAAKAAGIIALVLTGWILYRLSQPMLNPPLALVFALLVAASGHMLWFALSGMETILFLCLALLALLLYRRQRWVLLGITLGLLILTRPDGLALPAAIGLVELWKHRRHPLSLPHGLLVTALICVLISVPWFWYLLERTGSILPTSAMGKQTSSLLGIRLIVSRSPQLAFLADFPVVIYAGTWIAYMFGFVLGGASFPGPKISLGAEVGNANYALSLLALAGWLVVIFPLLFRFGRQAKHFWQQKMCRQEIYRPVIVFTAWLVLHNLAYSFFLPIPGTASRYGTVNHVALWLALLVGLLATAPRRTWQWFWAAGLAVFALTNTFYWNSVYDANLEHMTQVRIPASLYVRKNIPSDERVAAFDVGAMRYFSQRPILDLGGLIDPELDAVYQADGKVDRYLAERDVRYVVLPGRTNTLSEGWFDFAREMGLTTSTHFQLQQIQVFEIAYDRWLLGYLPTNNYQATVTMYQLVR